jgi:hypothetical protein
MCRGVARPAVLGVAVGLGASPGGRRGRRLRAWPITGIFHPNSDETFLAIEGRFSIEFESGSLELDPGKLLTIPGGVRHRTRPVGAQSVNLTFELAQF